MMGLVYEITAETGTENGTEKLRLLIGGKACGLRRLMSLGLPVPPAFVVTTEMYHAWAKDPQAAFNLLGQEIGSAMLRLQEQSGRVWGGVPRLLVSVRSGAPVSMPGMMDTVLNVGASPVPWQELRTAIEDVLRSWGSPRAVSYRRVMGIDDSLGTGVIIQAMIDGAADKHSGTGVVFTRNPSTGANEIIGEFLPQALGTGLVEGTVSPQDITALHAAAPEAFHRLMSDVCMLESAEREVQDVEFTVESGKLWYLQTRAAKCTIEGRARILVDMVEEGMLDRSQAVARFDTGEIPVLYRIDPSVDGIQLPVKGLGVSSGVVAGLVCMSEEDIRICRKEAPHCKVILIRLETHPDDLPLMLQADGLITVIGGTTCHAAVVARQLRKPAVVGTGISIVRMDQLRGRLVTLDGASGLIYDGAVAEPQPQSEAVETLLRWQKEVS